MKTLLLQLFTGFFLFSFMGNAQIGPVQIIDNSAQSTGVSKMVVADLNQDGFNDIVASFTGSDGELGYYLNNNGNSFSTLTVIDNMPFVAGVSTGDYNNDGWPDVVAIGDIDFSAYLYLSNNGSFSNAPVLIETNIDVQSINDIETADFDGDGSDDFVIIGQHSINYYRNNGNATFSKEEILTTSTSPRMLECLDLSTADVNADGHLDLVVGETEGLVVYINSGSGIFTPNYYSEMSEIGVLVHPFDMDGDGDLDVVMDSSVRDLIWFRNDGSGAMSFETVLAISPNLHAFLSADVDHDGTEDLYVSYLNNISYFLNDTGHNFASETSIFQDASLYMDELLLMDVDNDGLKDYVWSGTSSTVAFHLNTNSLQIDKNSFDPQIHLYPNPSNGQVSLKTSLTGNFELNIFNVSGQMLLKKEKVSSNRPIELGHLSSGVYFVEIINSDFRQVVKLVVE